MQEVTNPDILAKLNSDTSSTPSQGLKEVTDPTLLNKLNNESKESTGLTGTAFAASSGLLTGALEGAEAMGGLAKNILKQGANLLYGKDNYASQGLDLIGQTGHELVSKGIQKLAPQTEFEQKAILENPRVYGASAALGNIGTQTGTLAKPLEAATQLATPVTKTLIPGALKNPLVEGAVTQGTLAAGLGAAGNPENPIQGALTALPYGLASGIAGGALGLKLKRGGDILDFETKNILESGGNPYSVEGITRIKKALKDNGTDMAVNQIKHNISNHIQEQIDTINPLNMTNKAPSKVIADLGQEKFTDVAQQVKEGFKPLREAQQQFDPTNFKNVVSNLKTNILPKQSMPEKPTINDMWNYRENLDDSIQYTRARLAAKTAKASEKANLIPLQNVRDAITQDMLQSADQLGLKDQFLNTQKIYQEQYLPFKSFNTASGKLMSPEDVNDAMFKLNKMFKARNININELNSISKSLGPDGKELVGKAMIQQIYRNSLDNKGNVNPKQYFTQLKKYNASGLDQEVWGLKTRQAAAGIGKILDGADESLKLGSPQDALSFYQKLPNLMASWPGRQLLQVIGSSKTPQTTTRHLIQQLLTGTLTINTNPELTSQQK